MNVNQWVRVFAGMVIMLSLALAHLSGQADLSHMSWLWLTGFVGLNLFQSGLTRFCPLEMVLKMLGVKQGCA